MSWRKLKLSSSFDWVLLGPAFEELLCSLHRRSHGDCILLLTQECSRRELGKCRGEMEKLYVKRMRSFLKIMSRLWVQSLSTLSTRFVPSPLLSFVGEKTTRSSRVRKGFPAFFKRLQTHVSATKTDKKTVGKEEKRIRVLRTEEGGKQKKPENINHALHFIF